MNSLLVSLGLSSWKSIAAALLLPPFPLLLLGLGGAALLWARLKPGWVLVVVSAIAIYLSACYGFGQALMTWLLKPPPVLSQSRIADLRASVQARKTTLIIVLGSGRESLAPEYDTSNLGETSMARLRFGLWLGRETGLPVGFAGGTGWAQADGPSEAEIAARIAASEFGRPLRWTEEKSRDTRENASNSIAKLSPDIKDIVLVTSRWHMTRALRAFSDACANRCKVTPAPMGMAEKSDTFGMAWVPTSEGFEAVRQALHEWLGLLAGS